MELDQHSSHDSAILGQKYAYATASLILGLSCYVSLLGLEKAVLAIVFSILALRSAPMPRLSSRRSWATAGAILGSGMLLLLPMLLIFQHARIHELLDALSKLQGGR